MPPMRRIVLTMITTFALIFNLPVALAANPKPGGTCSKFGQVVIYKNVKYNCIIKYKKLVWDSGTKVATKAKATPTPKATTKAVPKPTPTVSKSATPTPSPTPTPTVTPAPSPTPTPVPAPTPTTSNIPKLVPALSLVSASQNKCVIEIKNYDANFKWSFKSFVGVFTQSGNVLTLTTTEIIDPTSSTVEVITSRSGYEDGSATIDCLSV